MSPSDRRTSRPPSIRQHRADPIERCQHGARERICEVIAMAKLFPTTLVGSYPQPDWLIDRKKLAGRFPPRVRAKELWRVAPDWLDEAQDDATRIAIRDQERAGLDIITDG